MRNKGQPGYDCPLSFVFPKKPFLKGKSIMMPRLLKKKRSPTVVMDAGIATEENLQALKPNYHYVCVSRKHMESPASGDFILIREGKDHQVEAKRISEAGEVFVYCKSQGKQKKEKAMQGRFEQHYEEELKRIAESIYKKGCT